jgi:tetratricopeptide (TPR) repeat protein
LVDKPLDRSLDLACRAIALDSECQEAEKVLATTYLYRGEMEQFLAHTERCLSLNPSASYYIGCAGLNLAIAGDWERALDLVDKAMQLNPDYPAYLHFVPFFNHFRKGEYEQALLHARQISPPSFYWAPGCRAAALGKLKREIEGRITLVELLTLRPDFPEHARELVSHLVFDQDIINSVLDGLYRAGLEQPVM